MSDIEDIEKLKSLFYQNSLTQYGKRKLINYYEKRIQELEEYIFKAPNLDEITASKYVTIQREAYLKGRIEQQQKAEQIIQKNYISKQKVEDKIEELKEDKKNEYYDKFLAERDIEKTIEILEELLQEEDK